MSAKTDTLAPEVETPPTSPDDLLVMELHVAGAAHRGTAVRLRRCATSGPDADLWMVLAGGKMLTVTGQPADQVSWLALSPALRRQFGHTYTEGLALARKRAPALVR